MNLKISLHLPLSEEVWCPCCNNTFKPTREVFSTEISDDLRFMAREAGLLNFVWYSDENNVIYAKQMVIPLQKAIEKLKANTDYFHRYEGKCDDSKCYNFLLFLEQYLRACKKYNEALIEVSR